MMISPLTILITSRAYVDSIKKIKQILYYRGTFRVLHAYSASPHHRFSMSFTVIHVLGRSFILKVSNRLIGYVVFVLILGL
jgi:hypothetical protein